MIDKRLDYPVLKLIGGWSIHPISYHTGVISRLPLPIISINYSNHCCSWLLLVQLFIAVITTAMLVFISR